MSRSNQCQSLDISDLNDLLCDLVDIHRNEITGLAFKRLLQCIFNLMQNKNVNLCSKIFKKLVYVMFADFDSSDASALSMERDQFVANVLTCVQLYVTKFPSDESKLLLNQLWSLSLNGDQVHPLAMQIFVTLFDDFVDALASKGCQQLLKFTQKLIQSKEQKERLSGYFLMHKLNEIFDSNIVAELKCTRQQWSDYIAALEQLEEQQMPLNLIRLLHYLETIDDSCSWLRILYLRLFQSANLCIIYETVKYIVSQLKFSHLSDWELMEEFLAATNRTHLYNIEDDERSSPLFKGFILISEVGSFIQSLVNVPWEWHSLPLWEWLKSMPREQIGQSPCIGGETLLKLASRVQGMMKSELQFMAQGLVVSRFQSTIDLLSLEDYLIFIETMYHNAVECYSDHERIKRKIMDCDKFEKEISYFTKTRLQIIFNLKTPTYLYCDFLIVFMDKLRTLPQVLHGWLRFFLLSCVQHYGIVDFYSSEYEVDTSLILRTKDIKKLQQHLFDKLLCETEEEKSLVQELSVDIFVKLQLNNWNEIEKFQLKPLQLLEQGGKATFKQLCHLLQDSNQRLQDENVLPTIVALLKKFPCLTTARNIGTYASKHLTTEEQNRLSVKIISNHIHGNNEQQYSSSIDMMCNQMFGNQGVLFGILSSNIKVPLHQIVQGIIHCSTLSEDAWIEANYLVFYGFGSVSNLFMLYVFEQTESYVKEVVEELLRMNMQLTETHPHYLSNSKEHKVKFCIALALLYLRPKYECSDMLWLALLSPNDQFNIILMYEVIVAETLRDPEILIERLHSISTLEANQQVSLLSVTNIFFQLKWITLQDDQIQRMIGLLLALAMGEDSQVRKFAKLILNKLIEICKGNGFHIPIANTLLTSIEVSLVSLEAQLEVRCLLPEIHFEPYLRGWQLNMSNIKPVYWKHNGSLKINKFRKAIKVASIEFRSVKAKETIFTPISNIYPKPNFLSNNNADLIVVAVLVDDLISLKDLMDTCQALNVQTLIVKDSTNLCTNTKKTLNIVKIKPESLEQYLREKKMENYHVVITQNTGLKEDFVDFTFTKRTILLLGDNQYDKLKNLKYIFDDIVELPQNDFQYAQKLLIFKYYKQHLEDN